MNSEEIGRHGENRAADFLLQKGYEILGRNIRFRYGEIDILCCHDDVIVIVEVKTSLRNSSIDPIFRIHPGKMRILRRMMAVIAGRYPGHNIRLDGIIVIGDSVRHFERI